MAMDRRWRIAIAVLVLVIAVVAGSRFFLDKPPEGCGPVNELLDFNRSQAELMRSKGDDVPPIAEDTAYQAWVDGLYERAHKVDSPELAGPSMNVANLANEFVVKLPRLRAATEARAPGASPPEVAYEMDALNTRITEQLKSLSDTCAR